MYPLPELESAVESLKESSQGFVERVEFCLSVSETETSAKFVNSVSAAIAVKMD